MVAYWTQQLGYAQKAGTPELFWKSHAVIDVVLSLVYGFIALVLWANAHRFGIFKGEVEDSEPVEPIRWNYLAYSILGLFIALSYLRSVLDLVVYLGVPYNQDRSRWVEYMPQVVSFAVGLGMWLRYGLRKDLVKAISSWPRTPEN
jgi:hypothetical protein